MTTVQVDAKKVARQGRGGGATRHVYDVIVVGSQLSGALSGALLAKRGYRVLHVDVDGLGSAYPHDGYALPYAPALLPSLKLLPSAEQALSELGVAVALHRAFDAGLTDLQLLFPKHRLDFASDAGHRAAELEREFASDKEKLLSSLKQAADVAEASDPFFKAPPELPPEGFFSRRRMKKAASSVPGMKEDGSVLEPLDALPLGPAMRAVARFLTYLDDGEASGIALARPLAQLLRGVHRYPGGREGLREALRRRLGELGGDLAGAEGEPAIVEELVFDGSKVTGVKLASSANVHRARCVIGALDTGALARLIPPRSRKRGLLELLESVRTRRYLFTLNLVLKTSGLPMGLKELALVVPGDEELGAVLLEVSPARKNGREEPDERVVTAAAWVSQNEREAGEERLRAIANRIEATVMEVMPFAGRHVVLRSAPYLDARNARGSRLLPHPLLEVAQERYLGFTGLPQRTPGKNLFLANREVLPGLGVEGEFMAGLRAAGIVQEVLKKHDPLA